MSAILPPEHHADWLDPNQHDTALPLDPVRPAAPEGWNPEPASRRANSPHDDDHGLIEPPTPAQPAPQATSDTTRQGAQPPLARPSTRLTAPTPISIISRSVTDVPADVQRSISPQACEAG